MTFITRFSLVKPFIYISEPRLATPLLATDEPLCESGKLACGNGDCIEKELFCNGLPDCSDGSDENACSKYFMDYFYIQPDEIQMK